MSDPAKPGIAQTMVAPAGVVAPTASAGAQAMVEPGAVQAPVESGESQ